MKRALLAFATALVAAGPVLADQALAAPVDA